MRFSAIWDRWESGEIGRDAAGSSEDSFEDGTPPGIAGTVFETQ